MPRIARAAVDAALRKEGALYVTLQPGEGYWYFVFDDGVYFDTHSVYVYRLNRLSLRQWLDEGMEFYRRVLRQQASRRVPAGR